MRTLRQLLLITLVAVSSTAVFSVHAGEYRTIAEQNITFDKSSPKAPTVLIFWASWCGYCMKEIPHLKALKEEFPQLRWIGVNVNKESADGLLVEQNKQLSWPSIADPDLKIADEFGIRGTPGLVVISTEGEILFKGRRTNDDFRQALLTASEAIH
ncbi:MAG: TlpA disulfide reductase family protein [Thalassolituus sp.]